MEKLHSTWRDTNIYRTASGMYVAMVEDGMKTYATYKVRADTLSEIKKAILATAQGDLTYTY